MERNRFPWPSRKSNHKIGRRRFIGPTSSHKPATFTRSRATRRDGPERCSRWAHGQKTNYNRLLQTTTYTSHLSVKMASRMAHQLGFGQSRSVKSFLCAPTTDRSLVGIRPPYVKRRAE